MSRSKARSSDVQVQVNKVKLFHKHIVEGKNMQTCADEIGVSRRMLHNYKNTDDYRQLAIDHLDKSTLNGIEGATGKLVEALDATRAVVTEDAEGATHITHVPDGKIRMTALQEVFKIYGTKAPDRTDATVTVAFSSDQDLFRQIDAAEKACLGLEQVETLEDGTELVTVQPGTDRGDFESRQRTLLQVDPVPEP